MSGQNALPVALTAPLDGLRVIEASAGTGKTWTITWQPPAPAWPLPLIKDAALQASSDFRGVLLRTQAGTIQIESVRWAVTDRGELLPVVLDAYGKDGKYQRYAGLPGQARSFDRTADLHDFLVRSEGRLVRVGHARIGADAEGYLTILDYEGIDEATGSPVVFSRKPPPAAISTVPDEIVECHMTDTRTYCEDDHCGPSCFQSSYPDCRCTAGTGS